MENESVLLKAFGSSAQAGIVIDNQQAFMAVSRSFPR